MSYLLFIDESGHDKHESPYEVLAGIIVQDQDVWNLITDLNTLEERIFGIRYSKEKEEIKGKKFLKRKVFRLAEQSEIFEDDVRRKFARECILDGAANASKKHLTALSQAKLKYVEEALQLCSRFHCKACASIVDIDAPRSGNEALRKDYSYLFERFYYFLEDHPQKPQGIVVFDELEKMQSKILLNQMERYFCDTQKGRIRSNQVIPEPFFVHSDLTTLIQIADLIAYIISWGFRISGSMVRPHRIELNKYAELVASLRYKTIREVHGNPNYQIWSFAFIDDLRGWEEKQE